MIASEYPECKFWINIDVCDIHFVLSVQNRQITLRHYLQSISTKKNIKNFKEIFLRVNSPSPTIYFPLAPENFVVLAVVGRIKLLTR